MFLENNIYHELTPSVPRGHGKSSLSIHPYFGKVDPSIASAVIELFSKPGQTVLDPFCGSGTVVHDAIVRARNVIGCDSSPLAAMVSASKVLGIVRCEIEQLERLRVTVQEQNPLPLFAPPDNYSVPHDIPRMPRVRAVSDWFAPNALTELATIRRLLAFWGAAATPESRLLARVAFSRIITSASLQEGESAYRRVVKPDYPGRVIDMFVKSVGHVIRSAKAFSAELEAVGGTIKPGRLVCSQSSYEISHGIARATLSVFDSRTEHALTDEAGASLVVTSPPYLMSWDYGLYHKFRFYWLGFDLNAYEETEIGRHLRRKKDDVPRYISDMSRVFSRLRVVTTNDARAVFINAPSVVYGVEVDTNGLLRDCASANGWLLEWNSASLAIPGPHHGMYKSLASRGATAPGQAGKTEHILVFSKTASKELDVD